MSSPPEGTPPGGGPIGELRREVVERLLGQADFVLLVVDPTCPGVALPDALREDGQPVALHIGYRLAVPIPDLRVDERGISGTLSFQHTPHACHLPWASIVQVSIGEEHLVWITPSLAVPPAEPPDKPPSSEPRPKLRLV